MTLMQAQENIQNNFTEKCGYLRDTFFSSWKFNDYFIICKNFQNS